MVNSHKQRLSLLSVSWHSELLLVSVSCWKSRAPVQRGRSCRTVLYSSNWTTKCSSSVINLPICSQRSYCYTQIEIPMCWALFKTSEGFAQRALESYIKHCQYSSDASHWNLFLCQRELRQVHQIDFKWELGEMFSSCHHSPIKMWPKLSYAWEKPQSFVQIFSQLRKTIYLPLDFPWQEWRVWPRGHRRQHLQICGRENKLHTPKKCVTADADFPAGCPVSSTNTKLHKWNLLPLSCHVHKTVGGFSTSSNITTAEVPCRVIHSSLFKISWEAPDLSYRSAVWSAASY